MNNSVLNHFAHLHNGITQLTIVKRDGSVHICLINTADYPEVSRHSWSVNANGYAKRSTTLEGKHITVLMHRQLSGNVEGSITDHINGCRLDNRRANLRQATFAENTHNTKAFTHKEIPIKGLSFNRNKGGLNIQAQISAHRVRYSRTWAVKKYGEKQAIALASEWIKQIRDDKHGEYARH